MKSFGSRKYFFLLFANLALISFNFSFGATKTLADSLPPYDKAHYKLIFEYCRKAGVFTTFGKLEEAEKYATSAASLNIQKFQNGDNLAKQAAKMSCSSIVHQLDDLSNKNRDRNDYKKANDLQKWIIAIADKISDGNYSPATKAGAYQNMGSFYVKMKQFDKAKEMKLCALKEYDRVLNELDAFELSSVAICFSMNAVFFESQGDKTNANLFRQRAEFYTKLSKSPEVQKRFQDRLNSIRNALKK